MRSRISLDSSPWAQAWWGNSRVAITGQGHGLHDQRKLAHLANAHALSLADRAAYGLREPKLAPYLHIARRGQAVRGHSDGADQGVCFRRKVGIIGAPEEGEQKDILRDPEPENTPQLQAGMPPAALWPATVAIPAKWSRAAVVTRT